MYHIKRHRPEKLFVTGTDCIIIPLHFKPYTVEARFIDAEEVKLPGCNPVSHDTVSALAVKLPEGSHHYGIQISWKVANTREVEWRVTELTS